MDLRSVDARRSRAHVLCKYRNPKVTSFPTKSPEVMADVDTVTIELVTIDYDE